MTSSFPIDFGQTFWRLTQCLFILLTAVSCSPLVILPGQQIATPQVTDNSFITFDGAKLPLRSWAPTQDPQHVIIALHGFNDYSNFINSTAQYFVEHNIAVFSYDQRGFGNSLNRGKWPGTNAFSQDLQTLIPLIRKMHPGTPVYLLGESMGGAVAMVALADHRTPEIDGVILVAPAVWARYAMPFYQRWALWIGAHTIPWKTVTGESLDIKASDNIEMLKKLGRDPLVIKKTRIDAIYGLTNLMDNAYEAKQPKDIPTLILYGENDEVVPKGPVLDVFKHPSGGNAKRKFLLYKEGYHMLLRDLKATTVMDDIVTWLDNPIAKLPSVINDSAQDIYDTNPE